MKTHIVRQTKHQLRQNISERLIFEIMNWMGILNDENELKVDE